MELRQLRYFVTVADERNFTRAASKLSIAQPPLSRQIKQLEMEFGAELFDRESRPIALTEAGRLLYGQAIQVLSRVDQLTSLMTDCNDAGRKRLTIGFVGSTIYGLLPGTIRKFRKQAKTVSVNLQEMTTLEQIAALKEGLIDVGFGRLRFDDPAVHRIVLEEEPLMAVLSTDHRLAAKKRPLHLADITQEPLILYPRPARPSYADELVSIFHDHGLTPQVTKEVRELQTAIGLVAADAGVCIVPASIQHLQIEGVVYRPIADANATSPIIMSFRASDQSSELAMLCNIAKSEYGQGLVPTDPVRDIDQASP